MGTEAFWVPALLSAAGTAVGAVNQNQALKRQNAATVAGIQDQQDYRDQANALVNKQIKNVQNSNPTGIANTEQGNFVGNLRKNQAATAAKGSVADTSFGAPASALPPAAGASSRYTTDKNTQSAQTQQYGNDLAGEIANVDAATTQRMNENSAAALLSSNLNTIGANSYTSAFVDQLRAKVAGRTNPWMDMFSTGLKGAGMATAMNPSMFASTPPPTMLSQYSGLGSGGNVTSG